MAGFILPGDRVDLVLTRGEGGAGGDAKAYADLLLQNVKVLAIDQIAAEGQEKPTVARAVTLELTQMEAQKVVLAQGIGRLSLILRQAGEVGGDTPLRVTASDLGPDATAVRDRLAEMEKQLDSMRKATAEAERRDAQRLAEVEARMRQSLDKPMPGFAPPPQAAQGRRAQFHRQRDPQRLEDRAVQRRSRTLTRSGVRAGKPG